MSNVAHFAVDLPRPVFLVSAAMSMGRRTIDRRRRVQYSTHQADQTTSTAASRREFERLREARRPTAAYGARVQRRLRGRWFSLVPVKRRTYGGLTCVISAITLLLCIAHYTSVAWPAMVYRPEIARPLRLDVPDSFGRWFMIALLTASAGIALMTYQLRRYRLDDYLGHYRLWRLVLIVTVAASLNALVGLIDWTGAILDLAFGKRVALTGGDWLRVVVGLGGAVLCLRMIAEMRRSRAALASMIVTCVVLSIGQAAQWNVMDDDTIGRWTLVTTVPLVASTTMFIAMSGYLRMLYREVREIEDGTSIRDRFERIKVKLFTRSDDEADSDESISKKTKSTLDEPSRAEQRRAAKDAADDAAADAKREAAEAKQVAAEKRRADRSEKAERKSDSIQTKVQAVGDDAAEDAAAQPKRGWFSKRSSKPAVASETPMRQKIHPAKHLRRKPNVVGSDRELPNQILRAVKNRRVK